MDTSQIVANINRKGHGARSAWEAQAALVDLIAPHYPAYRPTIDQISAADDGAWNVPVPQGWIEVVAEHGEPIEGEDAEGNWMGQTDADVARVIEEDAK